MAKLEKYYNLCFINDIQEFPGISIDSEPRCIINTLGKNIVVKMRLTDQKQIQSWTTIDKLTTKVIYEFKTNQYIGVFNFNYIRCWNENVTDINKVKKIKLKSAVADLCTYDKLNSIVLYKNGLCESFESVLKSKKSEIATIDTLKDVIDPTCYQILQTAYFRTAPPQYKNILFTYFVKHTVTGAIELIYFQLNSNTLRPQGDIKRRRIIRSEKNVRLTGYTVVDGSSYPNLVSLWSDNRIFMAQIRDDESTKLNSIIDEPGYFTAMLNVFNMEHPLSIIGISTDSIAIYGANATQEGASLIIYNTQFNIIRSKEYFKVYFKNSRMWLIDQQIFLAMGQNLAVVSFHITKEQLSNMIGAHSQQIISKNYIDKESINEECNLEDALQFDDGEPMVKKLNQKSTIRQIMNRGDSKKTINNEDGQRNNEESKAYESIKKFTDKLNVFYQYNTIMETSKTTIANPNLNDNEINFDITICSNTNGQLSIKNDIQMIINELENYGYGELETLDTIIPILIQCDAPNEILYCLNKYTIFSEKSLVMLLKYIIKKLSYDSNGDDQEDADADKMQQYDNKFIVHCNIITIYRNILNQILRNSFAETIIISHLRRKIAFDEAVFILNHIYNSLTISTANVMTETKIIDDNEKSDNQIEFPNNYIDENQLIAWFTIILDSHYQHFVITKNSKLLNVLQKWNGMVDTFMAYQQDLKIVLPLCHTLFKGKQINSVSSVSKWYSVEMVRLW